MCKTQSHKIAKSAFAWYGISGQYLTWIFHKPNNISLLQDLSAWFAFKAALAVFRSFVAGVPWAPKLRPWDALSRGPKGGTREGPLDTAASQLISMHPIFPCTPNSLQIISYDSICFSHRSTKCAFQSRAAESLSRSACCARRSCRSCSVEVLPVKVGSWGSLGIKLQRSGSLGVWEHLKLWCHMVPQWCDMGQPRNTFPAVQATTPMRSRVSITTSRTAWRQLKAMCN